MNLIIRIKQFFATELAAKSPDTSFDSFYDDHNQLRVTDDKTWARVNDNPRVLVNGYPADKPRPKPPMTFEPNTTTPSAFSANQDTAP